MEGFGHSSEVRQEKEGVQGDSISSWLGEWGTRAGRSRRLGESGVQPWAC